ncbi:MULTISPECIES: NADPH-dependent FMN reductase [unclassified Pseudoxanthomonas]|uniref:NADPH-dependent FMN reductase n=1 Tax=unclassified Pseudoxanthomonas TaxID=2645906 RepID=UPI0016144D3E|nr:MULTISPECIES: NADPH-dependent FMN reductase [unclassified Pseudoxanthomonas]MBB3277091.1 chromate reductase [Pseudoxanthomonas sp. OG2]MBV7475617.1 NAD(P)H-dependent oxidoreductase [Pseudoxanthomonas sp. PXM05]
MPAPVVAIIIGSLRKDSFNRQLAGAVQRLAGDRFAFRVLEIGDLPLYNQDDDADFPAAGLRFKQGIEQADALLFVTPEYNRSMPGVLKNAIDVASRPAGSTTFAGKRAGIIGTSPGMHGTVSSQQHLRNVLAAVDVAVLPQPEIAIQFKEGLIDAAGDVVDERARRRLQMFLDRFETWLG